MKKFEEVVISSIDYEPIVGGRLGDWLQQLIKNQNEIIDYLERYNPTIFQIYQRSVGDDK